MKKFLLFHIPLVLGLVLFPTRFRSASAQDSGETSRWTLLPEGGPFIQLPSNPEEPRTGIRMELGTSRMRLDVGTGFDLFELNSSPNDQFRAGLIIFAYALTTNNQGLRLQIDALDGFFGGHTTYRRKAGNFDILIRLRILHRSAHFVDGHIDPSTADWTAGRGPISFTRDFGEILGAIDFRLSPFQLRFYSGVSYATLVRPTNIKRIGSLFGIDCRTHDSFSTVLSRPFLLYAGYQLGLTGIPSFIGTSVIEGGMKFGTWAGTGVRIFVSYNHGLEVFGQYYDVKRSFWQAGFSLDLH